MNHSLGTIREFRTRNFTVIVDAIEEDCPDLPFDETGEVAADIESGRLILFCVRARVFYGSIEVAADYLGNCIYSSLQDFMDHKECAEQTRKLRAAGSSAVCGSYFSDMVRNVCREARRTLANLPAMRAA